jgi:hypothetical protein
MSPVRYDLGIHIPADILHSHRRENLFDSTILSQFLHPSVRDLLVV